MDGVTVDDVSKHIDHGYTAVTIACLRLVKSHERVLNCGFVYAGTDGSLLKVGMSRGCPICRMQKQKLFPLAVAWSLSVFEHEQRVIASQGMPVKKREWFDNPEVRVNWLVENRMLNSLIDLERSLFNAGRITSEPANNIGV